MNSLKPVKHARPIKPSQAETVLKQKHEMTRQLIDQIAQNRQRNTLSPDYDFSSKNAQNQPGQHNRSRHNMLLENKNQNLIRSYDAANQGDRFSSSQQPMREEPSENMFSQSTFGNGSIHNSINVAINYTVHQQQSGTKQTEGSQKRKKTLRKKSRKSTDKMDEKRIMNTSLTKLIDKELLRIEEPAEDEDQITKVLNNKLNKGSLTNQIFHGDKIYLKNGNILFKPLGLQTVLQTDSKAANLNKNPIQSVEFQSNQFQKRLGIHTTEENIALQQQLNYATAEDLLSLPIQHLRSPDVVQSDFMTAMQQPAIFKTIPKKQQNTSKASLVLAERSAKQAKLLQTSKSAQKDMLSLKTAPELTQLSSIASLQQLDIVSPSQLSLAQNADTVQSRQLHPGLQEMSEKLRASSIQTSFSNLKMIDPHQKSIESSLSNIGQPKNSVQFADESTILLQAQSKNRVDDDQTRRSVEVLSHSNNAMITGGSISQTMSVAQQQDLFRLSTSKLLSKPKDKKSTSHSSALSQGTQKLIARKQKEKKSLGIDEESQEKMSDDTVEKIKANTVFSKPREYSSVMLKEVGASALSGKEPSLDALTGSNNKLKGIGDLSRLVLDHKLHKKNKRRIKNLINLIGKGKTKGNSKSLGQNKLALQQDDAVSAVSIQSSILQPASTSAKKSSLPMIGRANSMMSNELPASTQIGTDMRGSIQKMGDTLDHPNLAAHNTAGFEERISIQENETSRDLRPTKSSLIMNDLKHIATQGMRIDSPNLPSHKTHQFQFQGQANKLQQNPAKNSLMRQSMFNKNLVTLEPSEEPDSNGDHAFNLKSAMAKHSQKPLFDNSYAVMGADQLAIVSRFDQTSSTGQFQNANIARSLSSRKLKPIQHGLTTSDQQIKANPLTNSGNRTQSLSFQGGLTYVMIKGKAQPSKNYIKNQMMPYATTQFQSLPIKSNATQKARISQNSTQNGNQTLKDGSKANRGKKLKGNRMRRREVLKQTGQYDQNQGSRKGVIEELEQEYSLSNDGSLPRENSSEIDITWQEQIQENSLLKVELLNQIAIFEQYLKVAILQQKARAQKAEQSGQDLSNNDLNLLTEENFDFELHAKNQILKSADRKNKISFGQQQQPNATLVDRSHQNSANQQDKSTYTVVGQQNAKNRRSSAKKRIKQSSSLTSYRSTTSLSSRSKLNSERSARSISTTKKILTHSRKKSPSKMKAARAMETLGTLKSNMKTIAFETTHTAHQVLVTKIDKLWQKLHIKRWSEVANIQNEIRRNKLHIQQLTRDNLFELDVNFSDQKMLLKTQDLRAAKTKKLKQLGEVQRVQKIQARIRNEINRKAEFDTWGFHNHIIEYKLKVRMTEDLIDCAQRLQVKPDQRTQKELSLLKMLRDRTYEDLYYFVTKREKRLWRLWRGGQNYKPALNNKEMTLEQVTERVDVNMIMILYIEPRFKQLQRDIPPFNHITSEMISFCSQMFGNHGWLQLFQLKQLRKYQTKEQHAKQYIPPVDKIKKLKVDPYTLQIIGESEDDTSQKNSDEDSGTDKDSGDDKEMKARRMSAWQLRKPSVIKLENKLKTGYEPIIVAKQKERQSILVAGGGSIIGSLNTHEPTTNQQSTDDNNNLRSSTDINVKEIPVLNVDSGSEDNEDDYNTITNQDRQSSIGNQRYLLTKESNEMNGPDSVQSQKHSGYEGDVVQHLKDQVDHQDRILEQEKEEVAIRKSSWLRAIEKEKQKKVDFDAQEKRARAARLAVLFAEEDVLSADDEDLLDAGAADEGVKNFIEKIDTHLRVEKRILEAWQDNDVKEGDGKGS